MINIRNSSALFAASMCFLLAPVAAISFPSVYPTGTTIYQPDKTWSGYTLYNAPGGAGAILIDMNGTQLRKWDAYWGHPPRILPGGHIMGGIGQREPYQETIALTQQD